MPKDMRTWIQQLEKHGELVHIEKEVDPAQHLGTLNHLSKEKALLFENVKGYPGWQVLGQAPANIRHVAVALDTTLPQVVPKIVELYDRPPTPTTEVQKAPCKENIVHGDEVDLMRLPIHIHHAKDGGFYIGGGLIIVRDPDSGIYNMAVQRLMIHNKKRTGILLLPRHTMAVYRKYEERDEPMPIAVAIGHHPCVYIAAVTSGPFELDELQLAGSLMEESIEVVKAESVDLMVPARAEIVLEGHVPPKERQLEGPFGEFPGYYYSGAGMNPVIDVQCITLRNDAVYNAVQVGRTYLSPIVLMSTIYRRVREVEGGVELRTVNVPQDLFTCIVQMDPQYEGQAKSVLLAAISGPNLHIKTAIAVDYDVDPFAADEVMWAMSTRVNPAKDIHIIPGLRGHPLDPSLPELNRPGSAVWQRLGSKVIIDATKPPASNPEERKLFERVRPFGWGETRLEDWFPA